MDLPDAPNPPAFAEGVLTASDGLALAATSGAATADRPAVLLAHGFGQTRQSWLGTQRRLGAAGYRHFAFDMRGHGESGRNPAERPYAVADFVADLHAAADTLPDGAVLVGASMGGLTGVMAQAERPRFSALVLVDVTPRWENAGAERIQRFMGAHPDGFADFDAAADAIGAYLPHRERKSPAQLRTLLHERDGRLHWHWDPRLLREFALAGDALQAQVAAAARQLELPVLLISGGRSDLVSERTVADFLALVPHARHERIAHATHMVAGDDNDAFADVLLRYLGAQSSTTPACAPGHGAFR
jgi:pimeloyl-ACP methyl ester carboxylesterase